jgi:hypothetical protein
MAYRRAWQSLADAVTAIMACGISETEARARLCHAIADGVIRVRATVDDSNSWLGGSTLERDGGRHGVLPPKDLEPVDIDWQASRPLADWRVGRQRPYNSGMYPIARVDVYMDDVEAVLCSPKDQTRKADCGPQRPPKNQTREPDSRPQPVRTVISRTIRKLWPDAVPREIRAAVRDQMIREALPKTSQPQSDEAFKRAIRRALRELSH